MSDSTDRAFVAGATGYTGQAIVTELRARGIETHAHVRPDSPELARYQAQFGALGATVDTTPWTDAAMAETMTRLRPTLVFALLGTTRARARRAAARGDDPARETYERVDYGMSVMVLNAVLTAGIRPRFVYLSSLGVTQGTRNAYLAARARVEGEVRASRLPYTIARPSFITGTDRAEVRPGERAGAIVVDGLLGALAFVGAKGPRDRYGSLDAATLAKGLVRVACDPKFEDRVVETQDLR